VSGQTTLAQVQKRALRHCAAASAATAPTGNDQLWPGAGRECGRLPGRPRRAPEPRPAAGSWGWTTLRPRDWWTREHGRNRAEMLAQVGPDQVCKVNHAATSAW